MTKTRTLDDVARAVRRLQEELAAMHEREAAQVLADALGTFYTTSTEALIGISEALDETATDWTTRLGLEQRGEVRRLVQDARRLMNLR